jgi:ATP-dependent exoDNAse (exonuclease V) beta subunit
LCHLYHFQYNGIFVENDETIDIQREFNFFNQFIQDNPIIPYRTEWKIFDRSTKIAGTIDLICKNGDGYDIYDWKRSSKIHRPYPYQCGLGALSHLEDTSLNHYKLQQNLYRYMLENQYGMNIKSMKLVILHPDFNSYEIIDVERMDNEIKTIIRML